MTRMNANQAASLLEKWIVFLDMDNPKAWDRDEYSYIKDSCKMIRSSVSLLRGKNPGKGPSRTELATLLDEFIEEIALDDPAEWEKENAAFVKEVLEAAQFTVTFLRQKKA
ncbi:hypothetical protein [Paenibacillus sp. Marseille-Q4541]|uniref:hypothetical protein n=1 Tax=Paenibacillus sp. Marseille-Q4541 TaxID=2831522 RepID=UPI001BA68293|nr:hypothetical protein [Paenibacillus sp. Marseille-Q4541]